MPPGKKPGYAKRDILKERVVEARDEQKAASEQFKDALTKLKEVYSFDGGDLEKAYKQLQGEFDASQAQADAVKKRIRSMETVAGDLFAEWEKEIGQISNPGNGLFQPSEAPGDPESVWGDARRAVEGRVQHGPGALPVPRLRALVEA